MRLLVCTILWQVLLPWEYLHPLSECIFHLTWRYFDRVCHGWSIESRTRWSHIRWSRREWRWSRWCCLPFSWNFLMLFRLASAATCLEETWLDIVTKTADHDELLACLRQQEQFSRPPSSFKSEEEAYWLSYILSSLTAQTLVIWYLLV